MTLVLTLVGLAVALTALLLGVSVVLQGYLYNQPADRLPLRAAVGGLALACFLTFWTYLYTRAEHPERYGTVLDFTPTTSVPVTEFEAVRQTRYKDAGGKPKEQTVKYRWQPGTGQARGQFVDEANRPFVRSTSDYVTVALLMPDPSGDKPRFNAVMNGGTYVVDGENGPARFEEQGGARYLTENALQSMQVPSTGALVAGLGLNVLHFILWAAAFWAAMRFNLGHSLALTALFGLTTMLVLMPLLFRANAVKAIPA